MPKDGQGRPFEVLLNPLGVVSRTNPSQLSELFIGKIAEKLGHPLAVEDFDTTRDMNEWVQEQLQLHDLPDVEDVLDPSTGRKVKGIATGNRFFMKLHHMAAGKLQGRSGGAYSMDESPAKGGTEGCFAPKQRILTSLGHKRICEIVEKRLGCQVLTFSERLQDWVYRPIVDWFTYRAKVSDLITVYTIGGPCVKESSVNRTHGCLTVTRNHEVFTYDGRKVTAGELTCRDQLVTWGPVPTQHQKDFIAGTLLGDATADFNGVSMEHSRKQIEYVDWKQSVLAGLNAKYCNTVHDMSNRPGFKTKRCLARVVRTAETHIADYYTRLCYDGNHVKRITDEWLAQLSDLSIAVWVLDDGSIGNRSKKKGKIRLGGHIYIQGFDHVSRHKLNDWLNNRLGTTNSINTIGAISLTAAACPKLVSIIAEWVPWEVIPRSKHCLRRMVREIQKEKKPREIESVCRMGKVPLIISEIGPYIHDKPGITDISVYDFTVQETHTYIASTALVSNSKRMGLLESNALIAHGGLATLQDASVVRGQRNDDYWMQFMSGYNPTAVKVPFAYRKFVNQLKAAGVNVVPQGQQINIMAMTDRDVEQLAGNRELTTAEGVDWASGMKEIEGGLFDKSKTGGHSGNSWSYFKLTEPMPNPVMEEPIRKLLGLTSKKFEAILAGTDDLGSFGKGPHAIKKALSAIDLKSEIERQRAIIRSGRVSYRDAAIKKLALLKSAEKTGIHPSEFMLTKVPVLPPMFRPVAMMSNDMPLIDDANHLYKELFEANKNLGRIQTLFGDDNTGDERLAVYKAFRAVTGLGEPIGLKNQEQEVKGILASVFGSSPKYGQLQRRLISTTVDNVGRGVITPNPAYDMDTIGIPENSAYKIYDRPLTRRLVRQGMSVRAARQEIENRSKLAQRMLLEEMEERPVIASRAPVLHKFGIMAFRPQLVKSNTLQTSPLIVKGFGADYDGDTMNFHVPATDSAVREAYERLLPSKNLFKLSDMRSVMHAPANEYVVGLHHATKARSDRPVRVFRNTAEVREAYARGVIAVDDPIQVLES